MGKDDLPDLDDIMREGVGLTAALQFWSWLANNRAELPRDWKAALLLWRSDAPHGNA